MREIALDTETTGLDPATGHRVVEIGCVEMINRLRTGKFWHVYLNPERDMPPEAYQVHGLSNEFLKDKPRFSEKAEDFIGFISDSPLVIHNAQFDMKFINAELGRLGAKPLPIERAVDTIAIARRKFPGAPAKLDALCKRFGIDLSVRVKHGALLDAELLADVYLELMGGRQDALQLIKEEKANLLQEALPTAAINIEKRIFLPTPEEEQAHAELVKKLKNALWLAEEKAS